MTILPLCLAVIIATLVWRASRTKLQYRWRQRRPRFIRHVLCGRYRGQSPAPIYARLDPMDALAFEEQLLGGRHEDATRRILAANCLMLTLLMPDPAIAQTHGKGTAADEKRIASCIHQAARDKPWLEKTLSALHDEEGGWIGAAVRNTDGSYDLGPMQINSQWITPMARLLNEPTVRVRRWLQHDACFNVQAARWLFLSGLAASSDYWTAVGSYHSPTRWRQRRYAIAVSQRMERRSEK